MVALYKPLKTVKYNPIYRTLTWSPIWEENAENPWKFRAESLWFSSVSANSKENMQDSDRNRKETKILQENENLLMKISAKIFARKWKSSHENFREKFF